MNYIWDAFWILFMLSLTVAFIAAAMKERGARKKAAALLTPAGPLTDGNANAPDGQSEGFGDFPSDPMSFDDFK